METNFFNYICSDVGEDGNTKSSTSLANPLKTCQCDGDLYYGMPDIAFSLNVDQYETKFAYRLSPD